MCDRGINSHILCMCTCLCPWHTSRASSASPPHSFSPLNHTPCLLIHLGLFSNILSLVRPATHRKTMSPSLSIFLFHFISPITFFTSCHYTAFLFLFFYWFLSFFPPVGQVQRAGILFCSLLYPARRIDLGTWSSTSVYFNTSPLFSLNHQP